MPRPYVRRRRTRRIVAAIVVGGVATGCAILTSVAIAYFTGSTNYWGAAVSGFIVGSVAAAVAAIMMPVIRVASGRSVEARLLTAASPAHPLLRALMLNAPGTYAHSVAVANLGETAADEIGANALLTRVGAYYHDVGKVQDPELFFENLQTGENPHDFMSPGQSVQRITAHVHDGETLVREYRLPHEIEDIVRQHHGTSLVRYFYQKAASQQPDVYEADFRYQAQKPTTREAALVMLADASEAAVRAARQRRDADVPTIVHKVIAEKVADGQLEDSGLSDDDISCIEEIYADMLSSMYHARLEYPEIPPGQPAEKEVAHAGQRG